MKFRSYKSIGIVLALFNFCSGMAAATSSLPAKPNLLSSSSGIVNSGCGDDKDEQTKIIAASASAMRANNGAVVESYHPPSTNCVVVIVPGTGEGGGGFGGFGGGGYGGIEYPGDGPGTGGSASSGNVSETSLGKGMENSRPPGCQREELFMAEVEGLAMAGQPPGIVKMTNLGDPLYSDPAWVKMESDRLFSLWRVGMPSAVEFKVRVHYMYNRDTHVATQFKLKNSFQYGCEGFFKN